MNICRKLVAKIQREKGSDDVRRKEIKIYTGRAGN
jgi:hypothetical protein